jgi:hypothetical protein
MISVDNVFTSFKVLGQLVPLKSGGYWFKFTLSFNTVHLPIEIKFDNFKY